MVVVTTVLANECKRPAIHISQAIPFQPQRDPRGGKELAVSLKTMLACKQDAVSIKRGSSATVAVRFQCHLSNDKNMSVVLVAGIAQRKGEIV